MLSKSVRLSGCIVLLAGACRKPAHSRLSEPSDPRDRCRWHQAAADTPRAYIGQRLARHRATRWWSTTPAASGIVGTELVAKACPTGLYAAGSPIRRRAKPPQHLFSHAAVSIRSRTSHRLPESDCHARSV